MKKFLSLLLALTLVLSLVVVPARADNVQGTMSVGSSLTIKKGDSSENFTMDVSDSSISLTADITGNPKLSYNSTDVTNQSDPTYLWTVTGNSGITFGSANAATTTVAASKTGTYTLTCTATYTGTVDANSVTGTLQDTIEVTVTDAQGDAAKTALANAVKASGAITYNSRPCTVVSGTVTGYTYSGENHSWSFDSNKLTVGGYSSISFSAPTSGAQTGSVTVTGTTSGSPSKNVVTTINYEAVNVSVPITSSLTGTTATNNEKVLKGGSLTLSVPSTITGVTSPSYEWFVGGSPNPVSTSSSYSTFDTTAVASAKTVTCKIYSGSGNGKKLAATSSCAVAVVDETYTLKVTASATTLTALNQTATVTANLYRGTDTGTQPISSANLKNWNMSVTGTPSAFTTNYTSGNNSLTLTAKSSGTVTISATVTYMGKTFTTTAVNCATVTSSILSYTLPAIQSGTYADYSNSTLLNYANQIVGRPIGSFKSITATPQSDTNGLGTLTASYVGTASEQYRFSNVSATRKIGLAQFSATAYTGDNKTGTAYTVYFNVPVEPTGTTYPDQYPEPVASYGNTYRYYVQVPSGYYSYYVVGTPNQATRPTDWSQGSSSVYYTTTSTSSLYSLTDANFVGGKCTLWIVTADSSGRLSCGQLTVYQKNYNINYNGVAGETVQFKHTDFTNFMNEVAQARGDSSKTGSYPYVTFSYVTFDYPSTAQGTLYYNGTAMSTSSYSGAFNSRTQITNLDNITFVPYAKTNAKTVAVTFTLHAVKYGTNGTVVNRDVQYRGTVNISLVREDVTFTVAPGDSVTFTDSAFLNYLRAQSGINYNYNIDYVTFDQSAVDTINGGVLYSGYAGFNAVKPTDRFYYTTTNNYTQNALSDVTFRASTYAKTGTTVYIPFTIYARYGTTGTGTRQVTGTVAVKIAQTMNFVDVKPTDYFYNPVKWAVGKNITKGTSAVTFSPDRTCTRAEIVTFLWRDAGSPMPTISRSPFSDVNYSMGADFYNAILWASQNGITAGTDVSHFSPNKTCTRAEIVTFLWRYAKKPVGYGNNSFTDVNKADHAPYYDAILWAVSKGITNGSTTTTFAPDGTCTRGQAVTFLYRYEGGK